MLKKQFKERDVQRLRNLVTKKYGDKTTQGVGYTKVQEFHNEGDIWEEDGRKWTIKNGVKQNITKLDKAKKGIILPLFCPSCSKMMKPSLDKQWYIMYNHCFDCQVIFESNLRRKGEWEEYEKNIFNADIEGLQKDFQVWIEDQINESNSSYVTEAGDVENWVGSSKSKLLEAKAEALKYLESLKKK